MDTSQLTYLCKSNKITASKFGGVYASNELKLNSDIRGKFIILNTSKWGQSGKHWVILFIPKRSDNLCELFNSLSGPIANYSLDIENLILVNGSEYLCNDVAVQSQNSIMCGLFCLYFAHKRCSNNSFQTIMNSFNQEDLVLNDDLVAQYVNSHFPPYWYKC